jgi:hypothetical protein
MSITNSISGDDPWGPQLATMTVAQKQDLMHRLMIDLSQQPENLPSPAWHEEVLRERDKAVAEERDEYRDWEIARREIRERFQRR